MIKLDKTDMQRFTVSAIGALALSATCIFAAVGPAKAAERAPISVAAWQDKVQRRIETAPAPMTLYGMEGFAVSQVAVRFTADGDYAGAVLAQSSGDRLIDAHALRVARGIHYPAMPDGFRGTPTQVRMVLYFGPDAEAAVARDRKTDKKGIQLAAL